LKAVLRPHQSRALNALKRSILAGHLRPVVQAPTGAGKTILAAAIVEGAQAKGNRVVFCVPAISLIDQTVRAFYAEGIDDIGVIQADHPMTDAAKTVQVASVQTLEKRGLPAADVVIVDECHRKADVVVRWMAKPEMASVPFIGMSATPWRKGMGKEWDDLIIAATTAELIEAGYLCPFRVFAPSHPDLTGVRTRAGDYHEGDLSKAMDKPALVADVVTTWLERAERRPTLVFAVDRAHAAHLAERFKEAGVSAAYQDANTDAVERETIRRQFHNGDLEVVCNVGTLTTGVDWDVRCIVLARPTKSEMLFVQIVGRGLRTAKGKPDCMILDHSDTHLRLGLVTDIHHETLDDGTGATAGDAAKSKPKLPKECTKCSYLKPAGVHQCPSCGFAPTRQSTVEDVDGELVEIGKKKRKTLAYTDADKRRWFGALRLICTENGYSPGWAANKYRKKFGAWPDGVRDAPMVDDPVVRSWAKSEQIRYAKARTKARGGAPQMQPKGRQLLDIIEKARGSVA
jgi:DNA repair protein RadD